VLLISTLTEPPPTEVFGVGIEGSGWTGVGIEGSGWIGFGSSAFLIPPTVFGAVEGFKAARLIVALGNLPGVGAAGSGSATGGLIGFTFSMGGVEARTPGVGTGLLGTPGSGEAPGAGPRATTAAGPRDTGRGAAAPGEATGTGPD